ncbi:MAG: D-lactate dehydrogenase family protein [Candidatus Omnitrophota bacterium]
MEYKANLLKLLKKADCFSAVDNETLRLLVDRMKPIVFNKGKNIYREGEKGDSMLVIESGKVEVLKEGEQEIKIQVAVLQKGDIAGEMSLFGKTVRSATLHTRTKTKVWTIDHATFQKLLNQNNNLAKGLLAHLSKHLHRETSVVAKLLSSNIDKRLKIAFFDSKSYMEEIFKKQNRYNYSIQFFESRLSLKTVSLAAGCKIVCVFVNDIVNKGVIEELKDMGVEMIALRSAGYNNVDIEACKQFGITVARVPAYSPYAVAEHAVALMMTLNRKVHRANNRIREGNFSLAGLVGFDIHGKTAGIIGPGKIGKCLINILAGFGCKLLAYARHRDKELEKQTGVCFVPLDKLLAESDIISLHIPLTPETRHIIDKKTIKKMKKGVMLINTGRGALIDTKALLDGLKNGKIGYAGLDVYEDEQDYFFEDFSNRILVDDILARLTTFNNVIVTSHQGFLTKEALQNIADTTIENIREYEKGKRGEEVTNSI